MKKISELSWWAAEIIFSIITVFAGFFMLELSSEPGMGHIWEMEPKFMLLNLLTLGVIWAVFLIVSNRVWLSNLLFSAVCGIIAIANHYVIQYHGMPLSFLEIKNFATAMNVISSYSFRIDRALAKILFVMLVLLAACILFRHFSKGKRLKLWGAVIRDTALIAAAFCVFYFGYFGPKPIKPQRTNTWLWSEAYYKYGFTASTVESIYQYFNVVAEPEGYSEEILDSIPVSTKEQSDAATPDIILILNETFFDLRQITDIETDIPYLSNIENMENLLAGYAISPVAGGGTNSSEYELLTSNSLQLMPGITPFNVLDLSEANSIVSYLNHFGYSSTAAHPEVPVNYSRVIAYPALGFQNIYFDDAFVDKEMYCDRTWYETDQSVYNNLIRWYEEEPEDLPRFMYLLTIQNHGDYNFNPPEADLVHSLRDYGEYTDLINEFLTCIYMSDEAFKGLTDYFSDVDRPVIICMLGDHAPSFSSSIVDEKYTGYDKSLQLRKVPLVIWANFELKDIDLGTMSMNYVVPTLLDLAGVELSPYYQYLLQLKENVPVLTSYGVYYDSDDNIYQYNGDAGEVYQSDVDRYFYLEYNNLQTERRQELFDPVK